MTTLAGIQAAPQKNRVGVVSASRGKYRVSLVVLPQAWRPQDAPRKTRAVWAAESTHLTLAAYEQETIVVECAAGSEQRDVIDELLTGSGRSAKGGLVAWAPASQEGQAAVATGDGMAQLLQLCLLMQRTSLAESRLPVELGAVAGTWLWPIIAHLLVREVRRHVHDARRSYIEETAPVFYVRGRPDTVALARAEDGFVGPILCTFETFTDATPILRVVVAALEDVVSAGRGGGRGGLLSALAEGATAEAGALRRFLARVPSTSRGEALALVAGMRPARHTLRWWRAVVLSRLFLSRRVRIADTASAAGPEYFEWTEDTALMWQAMVTEGLQMFSRTSGGYCAPAERGALPLTVDALPPWSTDEGGEPRQPDLLYLPDPAAELWCIDAKYKAAPVAGTPATADGYQMFAYSHLVRLPSLKGAPPRSALVYPSARGGGAEALGRLKRQQSDGPANEVTLDLLALPFPSPADVVDHDAWRRYLVSLGHDLANLTAGATPEAPTAVPPASDQSLPG